MFFYMERFFFSLSLSQRERETREFQQGSQLAKWKVPMKFEASGVGIFDTLSLRREIVRISSSNSDGYSLRTRIGKFVQPFSFRFRLEMGWRPLVSRTNTSTIIGIFVFLVNVCFNLILCIRFCSFVVPILLSSIIIYRRTLINSNYLIRSIYIYIFS